MLYVVCISLRNVRINNDTDNRTFEHYSIRIMGIWIREFLLYFLKIDYINDYTYGACIYSEVGSQCHSR